MFALFTVVVILCITYYKLIFYPVNKYVFFRPYFAGFVAGILLSILVFAYLLGAL